MNSRIARSVAFQGRVPSGRPPFVGACFPCLFVPRRAHRIRRHRLVEREIQALHFGDNENMAALLLILCALTSARSEPAFPSKEMLSAHNAIRSRVGLPPLLWSDNLAKFARDWANTLLARQQFSHRPNSPYGENLFEIVGDVATPQEVVGDWASEARDYDHRSNRCHGQCGHYTQIVWRNTKSVGCAVARGAKREIWVCNYDPPGNYVGRRPY